MNKIIQYSLMIAATASVALIPAIAIMRAPARIEEPDLFNMLKETPTESLEPIKTPSPVDVADRYIDFYTA